MNALDRRRFCHTDQIEFARFSGDRNPIHLDPVIARRTIAGQCIVHGAHSVLWVLNSLARVSVVAGRLRARFLKPIFLDEEISCVWNSQAGKVHLSVDGITLVDITFSTAQLPTRSALTLPPLPGRDTPAERSFAECATLTSQAFDLHGDTHLAAALFPDAVRLYGQQTVNEIAALSYIVGMEVPGMHSLLSGLRFSLRETSGSSVYSVTESDERFKQLRLAVAGHFLDAEVEAFHRPLPTRMPSLFGLRSRVHPGEHADAHALVIGGSRGLGEIVAKLIAAGGGRVIITYSTGAEDAERVVDEIRNAGGQCQAIQLTLGAYAAMPTNLPLINQLYYFATPKIFGRRTTPFNEDLYRNFRSVYVAGFETVCTWLIGRGNRCSALFPSSIVVEDPIPELAEYAKAKADGEALCQRLNENHQIDILTPRLPRTVTDQTQSLLHTAGECPADVIAPFVRRMTELIK
ncbi:SDR family NAD(P)-dependent oxidoreductase [Azoarcus sp. L1K30]|uniref:SDR family NAD(P)-dependent oxidoreductase n=1 Tax=Azoarcus sp. L1K30 TaxID=2820277 RepID=UPI001B83D285|nr:SDR family NAD(P)-dependent oxidoreductase [Azoarcus sp. L1K30]